MQNINVLTLRASGKLTPFLETIDNIEKRYLPKLCEELSISDVDIIICDDPFRAIPEVGVGGYTHHKNLISIYLDPNFTDLISHLEFELKSVLAHELCHAARWRKVGYKYTLLESMLSEGLADHFDIAFNGGNPKPWDVALSEHELSKYLDEAKDMWHDENYKHNEWFFGAGSIPRWAGYSLGYKLIRDHMERAGEKDVKRLIGMSAERFVS